MKQSVQSPSRNFSTQRVAPSVSATSDRTEDRGSTPVTARAATEGSAAAVKKRTASEALGAEADAQFDAESAAAPAAKVAKMHHVETIDVEDPDYVGEVAFNPETRLFAHALCDPFAAVATSSTACRLKHSNIFSTNVDVKGGRKNGKTVMGKSASKAMQDASHSTVPEYKCVTNRNKQHGEWGHLQADSLGGKSVPTNFVAARFAANTYMMVIEHAVAKRPYFAQVEAHGDRGVNDETPQVIMYHLWRSDPTIGGAGAIPAPHLTFVINPAMQSFTRDDQQAVHRILKSHNFSLINPIG